MKPPKNLDTLLQTWRLDPPPAPGFARLVWARIEAAEASPARLGHILPFWMPLAASFVLLFSATLGVGGALAWSPRPSAEGIAADYVRSVDALQMSKSHSH